MSSSVEITCFGQFSSCFGVWVGSLRCLRGFCGIGGGNCSFFDCSDLSVVYTPSQNSLDCMAFGKLCVSFGTGLSFGRRSSKRRFLFVAGLFRFEVPIKKRREYIPFW